MQPNEWSEEQLSHTIRQLLKLLSEPTTPHTTLELWCRIRSIGWERCLPMLTIELESDDAAVVRLVLNLLRDEIEQLGDEMVVALLPKAATCLAHEHRLVRQAAIALIQAARTNDERTIEGLKRIVRNDEPILRREAAHALLELEDRLLDDLSRLFDEPSI
jgi:hypothetical protein